MSDPLPPRPPSRSRVRTALLFAGALLFLFEEWLWNGLTRFFAWLGRFGLLRWLDRRLVRLPPVAALVILCLPMLLLFPVKIAGLWMIATGRLVTGCCVMLGAKVVSTAVIARIFLTCRPQLLRMAWFARLHAWTGALRERVHVWLEQQPAWRDARAFGRRIATQARTWVARRRADRAATGKRSALDRWRSRRRARRDGAVVATVAASVPASTASERDRL